MAKKLTHEEFISRWFSKPRKVKLVEGQIYRGTKSELNFTCDNPEHGIQSKSAENLLNDFGCQKCSALLNEGTRLTETEVRDGLLSCGFVLCDFSEYQNGNSWIHVACSKGHAPFETRYQDIKLKHTNCPWCKRETTEKYILDSFEKIYNTLKIEAKHKLQHLSLDKNWDLVCSQGHEFSAVPSRLLASRTKYGCLECFYASRRFSKSKLIEKTSILRPDLDIADFGIEPIVTMSKAIFRCKKHDVSFTASYHNVWFNNTQCPECNNYGFDNSKPGYLYYGRLGDWFKIGITNNNPSKRLKACHENYESLDSVLFDVGVDAYNLEQQVLAEYKDKLLGCNPGVSSGWTEMFSEDIFNGGGLTKFKK